MQRLQTAPTPWQPAPSIDGRRHPGEVRGPDGPVAYIALNVNPELRANTLNAIAAAPGMAEAIILALETSRHLPDTGEFVITQDAHRLLTEALKRAAG